MDSVTVSVLVDSNQKRLDLAAQIAPNAKTQRSIEGVEKLADIALIALPHHLHASIGRSLLEQGMHILVEKPLATSLEEARSLVDIAEKANRVLAVGQIRRYYETFRFVQAILRKDWLGEIHRFDVQEGGEYGWPVASISLFQKATGGGVLFDSGAHTLDTLVAWLGPVARLDYADDSRGGVDANCTLGIQLASGVRGTVELSRTRNLRNTFVIEGERGRLEVGLGPKGPVSLSVDGLELSGLPTEGGAPSGEFLAIARRQLQAFVDAVNGDRDATVNGRSVLHSIEVFDKCRNVPAELSYEWEAFQSDLSWEQFNGTRVLVLGATGFIGYRLVEVLRQKTTASVRALVRNLARLSNLARHDVEIVHGDVADPEALAKAVAGCDYVFNCTYGKGDKAEQYRINVTAVADLIHAAAQASVTHRSGI